MNFNDLKARCQAVKAPAIPQDTQGVQAVTGLIEKLKAQETKEAHQLKKARPLWLIAATAFLLIFAITLCLPSSTIRPARLLLGGVLAAVYLLNATLLGRKLRLLGQVDYAESLRSFLDKAELRHRFMGPKEWWFAGSGLTVLGFASGVYFHDALLRRYVAPDHQVFGIALYCLGYLLVCAAGFTFTYLNWKRDKAPLLAGIRKLRAELAADEAGVSNPGDTSTRET